MPIQQLLHTVLLRFLIPLPHGVHQDLVVTTPQPTQLLKTLATQRSGSQLDGTAACCSSNDKLTVCERICVSEVGVNGSAEEAEGTECEHAEKSQLRVIYGRQLRI
jgi:hypothetical protein